MLKVELFAIGGIGAGAAEPEGQAFMSILIDESNGREALKSLVVKATPEGGLYALFGLRILNCDCIDSAVKDFKERIDTDRRRSGEVIEANYVYRMSGCTGFIETKAEAVEEILSGRFDLWIKFRKSKKAIKKIKRQTDK